MQTAQGTAHASDQLFARCWQRQRLVPRRDRNAGLLHFVVLDWRTSPQVARPPQLVKRSVDEFACLAWRSQRQQRCRNHLRRSHGIFFKRSRRDASRRAVLGVGRVLGNAMADMHNGQRFRDPFAAAGASCRHCGEAARGTGPPIEFPRRRWLGIPQALRPGAPPPQPRVPCRHHGCADRRRGAAAPT